MITEENNLLQRIEKCRHRMNKLCEVNPLFAEEVVTTSQTLDKLLNQYDFIKQNKTAAS
jgi:hypothetical protein